MAPTAEIIQVALVVFGVGAVYLTQCKSAKARRWAPVVGLLGQPFWFAAAWGQPGMLAVVTLYTAVWAKGCFTAWVVPKLRPT